MYRIAICDDDAKMRCFLRQTVEGFGLFCIVDEFSDGMGILEGNTSYDILFLDIDMPRMNGIETAERLRKTDRRVKIIYVTGYQDYMSRSFAVHPFSFLIKPVRREEILRQVRSGISEPEASVRHEAGRKHGSRENLGIPGKAGSIWIRFASQEFCG